MRLKLKGCNIPFEKFKNTSKLAPGVLIEQDLEWDLEEEQYKSPRFAVTLMNYEEQLIKQYIEVEMEELSVGEDNDTRRTDC